MSKEKTKFRFTKTKLEQLLTEDKIKTFRDTDCNILTLKVYKTGNKTFFINGSCRGYGNVTQRLGAFPYELSVERARTKAYEAKAKLRRGINPADEDKIFRKEQTFSAVFNDYIENHSKIENKPNTTETYCRYYRLYLEKTLGRKKMSVITPKMIEEVKLRIYNHDGRFDKTKHKQNRGYMANRVVNFIRAVFNYNRQLGWKGDNPANNIKKYPEKPRQRRLNSEELKKLVPILYKERNQDRNPFIDFIIIALATGVRRRNIQSMRWKDINWKEKIWFIEQTKNGNPQKVYLSEQVIDILKDRFENCNKNEYVLTDIKTRSGHIEEPKKTLARVIKKAGLEHICIHGLRHTFASQADEVQVSRPVIKTLMGHSLNNPREALDFYTKPEEATIRKMSQKVSDKILGTRKWHLTSSCQKLA